MTTFEASRCLGATRVLSNSAEATERDGEAWGRQAERGQVYGLSGALGAGKTAWVRGFARGLGIAGRVQSPTFGLIHSYEGGRLTLNHLDLYRLETTADVLGAGLDIYLDCPDGVTVVEWPERWWTGFSNPHERLPSWHRTWIQTTGEGTREIWHLS